MLMRGSGICTPEQVEKMDRRLSYLLCTLSIRYGFLLRVLSKMRRQISQDSEFAMGVKVVGAEFIISWSPWHLQYLTNNEGIFCLYHEVMHVLLHHCTSRRFSADMHANIAQDISINDIVPLSEKSCNMPVDEQGKIAVWVSAYLRNDLKLDAKEKETAEYYYNLLKPSSPPPSSGSGNGKESKGKSSKDKNKGQGSGQSQDEQPVSFDDHSGWKESELAGDKVRAMVQEITLNNMWGDCPGDIKEMILAAQVRRISFSKFIRTWIGNIAWKDRESTRLRPNRRLINSDYAYEFPGHKKLYRDRYLVAWDVSGSITDDIGAMWIGVCNQICEDYPIDFMQVDCEKQTEPKPYDHRMKAVGFTGRGGTNFEPVMAEIAKRKYRGAMILTDGCVPPPTKPEHCDVLWAMPKGCKAPVDWGHRVYIERT